MLRLDVPRCPSKELGLVEGVSSQGGCIQAGCWDRTCSALPVTKPCGLRVTPAAAPLVLQGAGVREVPRNGIYLSAPAWGLLSTHLQCLCLAFKPVSSPHAAGFSLCCLSRHLLLLWISGEMQWWEMQWWMLCVPPLPPRPGCFPKGMGMSVEGAQGTAHVHQPLCAVGLQSPGPGHVAGACPV